MYFGEIFLGGLMVVGSFRGVGIVVAYVVGVIGIYGVEVGL